MRLFFCLFLLAPLLWAEVPDKPGTAAQIVRNTELRASPSEKSENQGDLIKGTIVILQGERQNGFAHVVVEIEGSPQTEGWVKVADLNYTARDGIKAEEEVPVETPAKPEKPPEEKVFHKTVQVPKDEAALFRRERAFLYGAEFGGSYYLMTAASGNYNGPGFHAAGEFGYYVTQEIPIRLLVGYSAAYGVGVDTNLDPGFFDVTVLGTYLIEHFEIFAGAQYAYAIGITQAPQILAQTPLASFSNFYGIIGGGYHVRLTEFTDLVLRARYGISFFSTPVFYQMLSGLIAIEIKG